MTAESLGFDHSPFMRFLGLQLVRADEGSVEIRLPFREEFLRSDGSDWLHGGVVSSLADIVGDYAVITKTGAGVPTIDLRVVVLSRTAGDHAAMHPGRAEREKNCHEGSGEDDGNHRSSAPTPLPMATATTSTPATCDARNRASKCSRMNSMRRINAPRFPEAAFVHGSPSCVWVL